jgi:hypothetical protein
MTESLPQAVLEAADVSAVSQLVLRERFSRDLELWEQMRDCFHDDSMVRISWMKASGPEFVRRSKEMAERNVQASHRLGPIFVTLGRRPRDRATRRYHDHGFGCSLTGRARRGIVRVSRFFVSFFGSSVTLLFAISRAGSASGRIGRASDGAGGIHGTDAAL